MMAMTTMMMVKVLIGMMSRRKLKMKTDKVPKRREIIHNNIKIIINNNQLIVFTAVLKVMTDLAKWKELKEEEKTMISSSIPLKAHTRMMSLRTTLKLR